MRHYKISKYINMLKMQLRNNHYNMQLIEIKKLQNTIKGFEVLSKLTPLKYVRV